MHRLALLLLLFPALALAVPKYVAVELKNGQRIMGKVIEKECTDQVLVVRQIRPPKKTTIPWGDIKDDQARELRVELGFEAADSVPEALLMTGHEIKNRVGTVFRGLWINPKTAKKDGMYILKTSEGERRIRRTDVLTGPDEVEINKLEVYTTRELYQQKIREKEPETAEDHYRIAEFCFGIDALEEAKLHYEKVLEFGDPKYTKEKIERNLARVQRLLDQSEARDAIREIKRAIVYKKFDRATELITAFKEKYAAEEDLIKQAEFLDKEREADRAKYYTQLVPRKLRKTVKDLLEDKVREEKELTLRDAQRYAGGDLTGKDSVSRQAIEKVSEDLKISTEDVAKFWEERAKRTTYKAFYRDGTFIVVENLEDALARAPKPKSGGGKDKGPTPPKPTPQRTPDQWWEGKRKTRKFTDMVDWLYAYWAEKSGMNEVLDPKEENCPTCFGKGFTMRMHVTPEGSIPFYNRCQTCHMAKHFRVVRFK